MFDEGTGVAIAEVPSLDDFPDGKFLNVINTPHAIIGDGEQFNSRTQLNVHDGGSVGNNFQVGDFTGGDFDVEMNVFGGEVGTNLLAGPGSVVNISGGVVGSVKDSTPESIVNVSGGNIGTGFASNVLQTADGGTLNISGGSYSSGINRKMEILGGGSATISGGLITAENHDVSVHDGAMINLIGSEFWLDGTAVADLIAGEPQTITDRDVALSGTLLDGSAFDIDLSSVQPGFEQNFIGDYVDPAALLTISLPAASLAGDHDNDGFVGQGDLDLVLLNWGASATSIPGDWATGNVDQNELDTVLLNWGVGANVATTAAIPEPATWLLVLVVVALVMLHVRRRRHLLESWTVSFRTIS